MLRSQLGDWNVHVCRDLQAVMSAWRERQDGDTGILHLGFDRPSSSAFDDIVMLQPKRMLLTAAARYGLTQEFSVHDTPLGVVAGLPIYLAIRGFGYTIEAKDVPANPATPRTNSVIPPRGWVAILAVEQPEYAESVASCEIFDDDSYIANEPRLEARIRRAIGEFRLRKMVGPNDNDPTWIARWAPPWLQTVAVAELPLTVRISNVLTREKVVTVGDLSKFDTEQLLHSKNFGKKSFRDLSLILWNALKRGPTSHKDSMNAAEAVSLLANVESSIEKLDARGRDILVRRMGLNQRRETLAEIGDAYGITRERIRQIESKLVRQIVKDNHWDDLLSEKLEKLLLNRSFPLPVIGVDAVEPWFSGIANNGDALAYILENMCGDRFHVIEIDSVPYFARIDGQQFIDARREARALLLANVASEWSKDHCQDMVASVLDTKGREFAGILWDSLADDCHFNEINGQSIFAGFGKSIEAVVEAALHEAGAPLHYSEIANAVLTRTGREIDIRRVHNAAQNVGFLFGRGLYGLAKHCEVDEETQHACRHYIENLILTGPRGRQWHCSELMSELNSRGMADDALDKYSLDIILRTAPSLQRLGRLTWASSGEDKAIARVDIRNAIVSIIRESGQPLTTEDITAKLSSVRGTEENLAIWNFDPVIRVGRRLWGLNDRDAPISRHQQSVLFGQIALLLQKRGEGIHVSETFVQFPEIQHMGMSEDMFCSLASHDEFVAVNSERYMFLREWGDARRPTLSATIETVLLEHQPITFEEILNTASHLLGQSVSRPRLSKLLQRIGDFQPLTSLWTLRREDGDYEESEDTQNVLSRSSASRDD